MATVVGIMDRPTWQARTDVIVVVDPDAERLVWVPRDLWSRRLRDRINTAFASGGHCALVRCLTELGLPVQHSLCVSRDAVSAVLADVEVAVPVPDELAFWYPLGPEQPIEVGKKLVRFSPPREVLSGERIHQWIGARYAVNQQGDDIERLGRQQVLLRELMKTGFDFGSLLADPSWISVSSDDVFDDLRRVGPDWRYETFRDFEHRRIDGKAVLVKRSWKTKAARVLARPFSSR